MNKKIRDFPARDIPLWDLKPTVVTHEAIMYKEIFPF